MVDLQSYPRQASIHGLFSEQAAMHPGSVALRKGDRKITYAQVEERSDAIARRLIGLGVKRGDIVITFVERSPAAIEALIAILKTGAAFAPLDPAYPPEHLSVAVADCRPAAIVVSGDAGGETLRRLGWDGPVLHIGDEGGTEVALLPHIDVGPLDAAYVMFTSGSTGRPKGVVVPHRAVVRLVRGNNYANLDDSEAILQLAPLAFDASTFEIWGALLNGGVLAFAENDHPTLSEISDAIRVNGVTTLWLTAGLFHLMVECELEGLKPLRQLLAGGDILSPAHVDKARLALPSCQLINGYGPTENTTFTCCYRVPPDQSVLGALPIGYPIAQTRVYVLDDEMRRVVKGQTGQLCAAGDGLALGYLNRPELTAQKFVPNPFSADGNDRLYLTGDLVRERADGSLDFVGRIDRQVKIGGKRIELEEVETVLRNLPQVQDAAVIVQNPSWTSKYLVAYLVGPSSLSQQDMNLRALLLEKLPEYAIPSQFCILQELPLLPNGKINRRGLLELAP
ncbi:amino acid adenylation domain-containing protein [Labrys sp. LIt4]|uniref:amino acid adenylation domain-containing protein n=1 Tax=Labrys sp. LIt4 TaxID=2821355 RepID=UPI001AE01D64|nr:amino acid adenylation domain-containing protein [Labrys sp. LIt4]MBP0580176.1 amino acid adenylation domain-containing protein [Labrys sp. LIt4]